MRNFVFGVLGTSSSRFASPQAERRSALPSRATRTAPLKPVTETRADRYSAALAWKPAASVAGEEALAPWEDWRGCPGATPGPGSTACTAIEGVETPGLPDTSPGTGRIEQATARRTRGRSIMATEPTGGTITDSRRGRAPV